MLYTIYVDKDAYDLFRDYINESDCSDPTYTASELLTWAIETKRERLWDEQTQARVEVTP